MTATCEWAWLGRLDYDAATALQRTLQAQRADERRPDTLLFCEHPPTITLGRRASAADILAPAEALAARGLAVRETNRGGLVTYHGPGQLVAYPVVAMRPLTGGDVVRYVWGLEENMLRVLAALGVAAERDTRCHGVWAGADKIGAVGVAVSRGVTMHGWALNLHPDLTHFRLIAPCGIRDRAVTSVAALTGLEFASEGIVEQAAAAFGEIFGRRMRPVPDEVWPSLPAWGRRAVPVESAHVI